MEGFIDAGFSHLEPLLYFRDWLVAIRNDRGRRMKRRRNGLVSLMKDGSPTPGPFTLETRQEILDRLLAVQEEVGFDLISDSEIATIRRVWADDALDEATRMLRALKAAKEARGAP